MYRAILALIEFGGEAVAETMGKKPFLTEEKFTGDGNESLRLYIVGYESGTWRLEQWVKHTFRDHLLTFGLSYSEIQDFGTGNAANKMANAAKQVYSTDKYQRRGEFGELFLHGILIDFFNAEPAISKIFYLDTANETAKGFDSVHVVEDDGELTLWLGEAKLYKSAEGGVDEAAKSVEEHLSDEYLRGEFLAITNKIDRAWPRAEQLADLLDDARSLDEIIDKIKIPILLTYNSSATSLYTELSDDYILEVKNDALDLLKRLKQELDSEIPVEVLLLLIPVTAVEEVRKACHEKLKVYQSL